jgi:hypothetical protein
VLLNPGQDVREITNPQIIDLRGAEMTQVRQEEKILAAGHCQGFAEQCG